MMLAYANRSEENSVLITKVDECAHCCPFPTVIKDGPILLSLIPVVKIEVIVFMPLDGYITFFDSNILIFT